MANTLPNGAPSAPRIGGSFAPPLDAKKLERYRELAESAEPAVKDAMLSLCGMAESFHAAKPPKAPKAPSVPHPSGVGLITPLPQSEVERLWDDVPWPHECDAIQGLFDRLPVGAKGSEENDRRNAAFHLLWYARELTMDRTPLTSDRLQG
jgi:hypothetical protein